MSPILGIWASQNYSRIPATSYESISTVTVGSGGSASISLTSIPSTYKHLQIRGIGRASTSQSASFNADMFMRLNSDTGANYARHRLLGESLTVSANALTSATQISWSAALPRSTSASNIFGAFVIDILDYADTNKYKTLRFFGGADLNGGGAVGFQSGLWMSTSAVSSMTFTFETDSNPNPSAQYSQIALYGIKG